MSAPEDLIGDRYRLVRRIGAGGMGVVWEAEDIRLQRRVAVKVLHQQPGLAEEDRQLANQRAMREARISARLHHRYAVPVFDVVDHHGQPCLVMQFVPSLPLSKVLRDSGPLQPEEAARVGAQVASALTAAHRVGIVHRDIKPGNILIADDGSALISDFGISHALGDATLTVTGMVHGTPAYLAPEVARGGDSSPASDVFSLGATMYAALEGSPPFGTDPNSIALLHRVAEGTFAPPQRSGAMAPLLVAMLSRRPEDRPDMTAVAQNFSAVRGRADAAPVAPIPGADDPTRARTAVLPLGDDDQTPAAAPVVRRPADPAPTVMAPQRPPVAPAGPPPTPPPTTERPKSSRTALVLAAALVAAVVLIGLLVWQLPGDNNAADPPTSSAPTPSASAESPTATPSSTPSSASPSPSPTPTTTPTRTPTPTPSRSASPTTGTPTGSELAGAIRTYYSLVPGNTDRAWPLLTASYQTNTSGGRAAYGRFWANIRSVSVSDVSGDPPDTARATLTYTFDDGSTSREPTTFQLIRQDGKLKINSSRVG